MRRSINCIVSEDQALKRFSFQVQKFSIYLMKIIYFYKQSCKGHANFECINGIKESEGWFAEWKSAPVAGACVCRSSLNLKSGFMLSAGSESFWELRQLNV